MEEVTRCPECGVPELFNQSQVWLNNGDIVQRLNPQARVGFIECENLDPLFVNIGKIIGLSIEHLIVNISARATAAYMRKLISQDVRDLVVSKQLDPAYITDSITTLCHVIGYGKYESLGSRYQRDEHDYSKFRITKPFSVPLAAGAIAGAVTSVVEGQHKVTYEEVSPAVYEFTTSWTEYPKELMRRFRITPYHHVDGDIKLERCASCGVPKAFSGYRWYLDEGLIINEDTGRRMAIAGPESLDRLFEELQEELGETIPEVVVEAQKHFVKTGFYSIEEVSDGENFRTQLALMGLGNLREMNISPNRLFMRIDNAAGYLMTVGKVQGLFEAAYAVESKVEWELSEDGELQVEVKPKA